MPVEFSPNHQPKTTCFCLSISLTNFFQIHYYYYCNCLSDYTLASRTPNLKSHDVNKSSFKTVHSFITESIPTFGESIPLLLLPTLISKFVNSSRAKSERENCKATAIQKHFYYYLRTYYCKNSLKLGSLRT